MENLTSCTVDCFLYANELHICCVLKGFVGSRGDKGDRGQSGDNGRDGSQVDGSTDRMESRLEYSNNQDPILI